MGWAANNSLTDLHPTSPEAFKQVIPQPLFRLTPALRKLHLDARKSKVTTGDGLRLPVGSTSTKRSAPRKAVGDLAAIEGTLDSGTSKRRGDIGRISEHWNMDGEYSQIGCENSALTAWTDRQRTMCLVPDNGNSSRTHGFVQGGVLMSVHHSEDETVKPEGGRTWESLTGADLKRQETRGYVTEDAAESKEGKRFEGNEELRVEVLSPKSGQIFAEGTQISFACVPHFPRGMQISFACVPNFPSTAKFEMWTNIWICVLHTAITKRS